jgi:hypothetical protein
MAVKSKYAVVEFIKEESVAVVLWSWIEKYILQKFIKTLCVLLIINDTWLLCFCDTKIMDRLIHLYVLCLMGSSQLDKKKKTDKR